MEFSIINGIKVYAPNDRREFLNALKEYRGLLIAINAEKIIKSNSEFKEIINANIGYPDGIGTVWALKQKGLKSMKIAGAEFWYDIVKRYYKSKSFYFIGGTDKVINATVNKLGEKFNGINIKGYRNGYLSAKDEDTLINDIIIFRPDIVFVAMGTPKQEFLMNRLQSEHAALYMGLGGSFDIFAGSKKRAPKWFIKLGLEWFYRLLKEPTRFKRQVVYLKFLILLFFQKL